MAPWVLFCCSFTPIRVGCRLREIFGKKIDKNENDVLWAKAEKFDTVDLECNTLDYRILMRITYKATGP